MASRFREWSEIRDLICCYTSLSFLQILIVMFFLFSNIMNYWSICITLKNSMLFECNSHRDTWLLPTAYFFIITVFHHYHNYLWREILLKRCTYSCNIFLTRHFTPIVLIIKHKSKLSSLCYKTQTWSNFSPIILQFMQRQLKKNSRNASKKNHPRYFLKKTSQPTLFRYSRNRRQCSEDRRWNFWKTFLRYCFSTSIRTMDRYRFTREASGERVGA